MDCIHARLVHASRVGVHLRLYLLGTAAIHHHIPIFGNLPLFPPTKHRSLTLGFKVRCLTFRVLPLPTVGIALLLKKQIFFSQIKTRMYEVKPIERKMVL